MKIYADNSTEPQKNTTSLSKRKLRVIPNGLPLGLESKSKKRHLYESLCDIWENKREFYKAMVWCQRKADVAHDRWSQLILASGWASPKLRQHARSLSSLCTSTKLNFPTSEKERQRYANCE